MFCTECGSRIPDESNYCTECGSQLKIKPSLMKKWWFWLIAVLSIFALAMAISYSYQTRYEVSPLTDRSVIGELSQTLVADIITDITIEGGEIDIVLYFETVYDADSFVKENQYYSAEIFERLFKNQLVSKVTYQADVSLVDVYGNSTRTPGQINTMLKADADKISDWDTFSYQDPSRYYSVVERWIAPEVLSELSLEY